MASSNATDVVARPAPSVPRTPAEWDAKFRENPNELFFGREPSEGARLTYGFWKLTHGDAAGRLLDLGCGEGRDAVYFARKGFRVTAVDGSEAALEKAARLAAEQDTPPVDWCRMDLLDFPLAPGYDVIVAHNSLQFVGDHCLPILRRIQEVTPPGGINSVAAFTREAESLAGATDLYRFDHNELKFHYADWRIFYYSEQLLWRDPPGIYLTFARIVAEKHIRA